GIVLDEPRQHEGGVLLLVVAIVDQDLAQLVVGGRVDALVVPVDRFELLLERRDRAVSLDRVGSDRAGVFVKSFRCHGASLLSNPQRARASARASSALVILPRPRSAMPRARTSSSALVRPRKST